MNDIMSSAAFQEFLQKRCEEIISSDVECSRLNSKIIALEKELLSMMSNEAKEKYLEIEELIIERNTIVAVLLLQEKA